MPVKWTAENDQLLLLKILETHDLSVDTKRVAEAWPTLPGQDRPTPRAITERLVRMRQLVKSSGNLDGHFSIAKGSGNVSSTPSTPRKPRKTPASTPGSGKRKRVGNAGFEENVTILSSPVKMEVDDGPGLTMSTAMATGTPTKKPLHPTLVGMNMTQDQKNYRIGTTLKLDKEDISVMMMAADVTPTKRTRRASTLPPGMVSYAEDEDRVDDVESSSASEYVPDEQVRIDDYDEEYA